mgnify:FL=1
MKNIDIFDFVCYTFTMPNLGVNKLKKEAKVDNKNKNNKKKKSVVGKIFKFILLLLLIAIIVYVINFAIQYFKHTKNMEGKEYDPLSAVALGIDPQKLKEVERLNVLILGESGIPGEDYKLTDSIMVASYNPQTQQASLLSIPRDTYVGKKDKNTATSNYLASYKINTVYRNGTNIPETIECVNNITGLNLDKYLLIDTDAIIEVVDAIGGVTFDVPIDMDYDDPAQDLHIHLKAGEQLIDGEKAEQLLRFRHNNDGTSYPSEYGDNDIGRMRTQREFIQVTAKQLLRVENVTKVLNLMDIVFKNVKTNLDMETLKYYIPYIFKFNTSNIVSDTLPGTPEKCNGIWIYTANKTQTKQVIEDLFTDKIVEEEKNEESTSTNTTDGENTTKESKEITIELLNGTGDKEILTEVKEKLKEKGYVVSKSGTTSSTDKTTIINRTSQSNQKSKDIKQLLGVGTITSGSNNTKVDFTIIIGKDYK